MMENDRFLDPSPGMFDDIDLTECMDPSIPAGYVRIDGILVRLPTVEDDE
jgi:hypothetical protein